TEPSTTMYHRPISTWAKGSVGPVRITVSIVKMTRRMKKVARTTRRISDRCFWTASPGWRFWLGGLTGEVYGPVGGEGADHHWRGPPRPTNLPAPPPRATAGPGAGVAREPGRGLTAAAISGRHPVPPVSWPSIGGIGLPPRRGEGVR